MGAAAMNGERTCNKQWRPEIAGIRPFIRAPWMPGSSLAAEISQGETGVSKLPCAR